MRHEQLYKGERGKPNDEFPIAVMLAPLEFAAEPAERSVVKIEATTTQGGRRNWLTARQSDNYVIRDHVGRDLNVLYASSRDAFD
jgi:hypothetical protein